MLEHRYHTVDNIQSWGTRSASCLRSPRGCSSFSQPKSLLAEDNIRHYDLCIIIQTRGKKKLYWKCVVICPNAYMLRLSIELLLFLSSSCPLIFIFFLFLFFFSMFGFSFENYQTQEKKKKKNFCLNRDLKFLNKKPIMLLLTKCPQWLV